MRINSPRPKKFTTPVVVDPAIVKSMSDAYGDAILARLDFMEEGNDAGVDQEDTKMERLVHAMSILAACDIDHACDLLAG